MGKSFVRWLAHSSDNFIHPCRYAVHLLSFVLPVLGVSVAVAKDADYKPPRTSDGRADLQGTWDFTNLVPLERLPEFKSLVISQAEADQFEAGYDARRNRMRPDDAFDEIRKMAPIRGELRSSQIVEPADGIIPGNSHFKQKASHYRAVAVFAVEGPEQRPAQERCLVSPTAPPPMQPNATANLHQIVQTPNSIVIHSEWNHDARIVRMNAKHGPPLVTSWLGDSIGWWEGQTLVVETAHFTATSEVRAAPLVLYFVSPNTVVTERFTLTSKDELHYAFTVTDDTYYVRPWKGETHLRRSTDRIYEFACHEGNYALVNILQGARVEEAGRK